MAVQTLGTVSLGLGVATDIVTAAALCFFLARLRTGIKKSDTLVNSLVRYAINTGALTSACSITTLVLFNLKPQNNLYFVATYFIVSKMYAISYMATLNSRRTIRGRGTDRQGGTTSRATSKPDNNTNLFHLGTRMPSMGPVDLRMPSMGGPVDLGYWESDKAGYRDQDFPLNTFAASGK
ncbi:hypothetical protein H0H87_005345 [Tephrocybe sp. NHM501043]|nr:hypothetical protein H0H87_005345 [Tephrocybe sp. NHM501043]